MKRFVLLASFALACAAWGDGCNFFSPTATGTGGSTDNHSSAPTPTPTPLITPTPTPFCAASGGPCKDNIECCSAACIAGACK